MKYFINYTVAALMIQVSGTISVVYPQRFRIIWYNFDAFYCSSIWQNVRCCLTYYMFDKCSSIWHDIHVVSYTNSVFMYSITFSELLVTLTFFFNLYNLPFFNFHCTWKTSFVVIMWTNKIYITMTIAY